MGTILKIEFAHSAASKEEVPVDELLGDWTVSFTSDLGEVVFNSDNLLSSFEE
jgi:hypothetical protein